MTQSPSTIALASTALNGSPDLLLFVEIVEVVNTAIGVPALSVNVRGGGGGGGAGAGAGAAGGAAAAGGAV